MLIWQPVGIKVPALPAARTQDVITADGDSPFGSFDANFVWLAEDFPSTLPCSIEYLDFPERTSNDETMELLGGEDAVSSLQHFTPLQMRFVTELSLKRQDDTAPEWSHKFVPDGEKGQEDLSRGATP